MERIMRSLTRLGEDAFVFEVVDTMKRYVIVSKTACPAAVRRHPSNRGRFLSPRIYFSKSEREVIRLALS